MEVHICLKHFRNEGDFLKFLREHQDQVLTVVCEHSSEVVGETDFEIISADFYEFLVQYVVDGPKKDSYDYFEQE